MAVIDINGVIAGSDICWRIAAVEKEDIAEVVARRLPGVSTVPSANCRCSTLCSQLTAPVALSVTVAQLVNPAGLPSIV